MVELGNDWDQLLKDEWEKEYYLNLRKSLIDEYNHYIVYPDKFEIFNALKSVEYSKVKVVILGQDPYHEPNQANGYAFSVKDGVRIPPSLLNIYKELHRDLGLKIPNTGNLEKWAKQGVLLLNSTLTVRKSMANSHKDLGWTILTDKIIALLGQRKEPIIFMLWGNFARSKKNLIKNPNHLILESSHPSPLSAHRGFLGSGQFSQANIFLREHALGEIDWQIEDIK